MKWEGAEPRGELTEFDVSVEEEQPVLLTQSFPEPQCHGGRGWIGLLNLAIS